MNPVSVPLLAVLNIKCILMPFLADRGIVFPLSRKYGKVNDYYGHAIEHYPDIPIIFEKLKNSSIQIHISTYNLEYKGISQLINFFGWFNYTVSFGEIKAETLFDYMTQVQTISKIPFNKIMYFDKCGCSCKAVRELGAFSVRVDSEDGLTLKILEEALTEYGGQNKSAAESSKGETTQLPEESETEHKCCCS